MGARLWEEGGANGMEGATARSGDGQARAQGVTGARGGLGKEWANLNGSGAPTRKASTEEGHLPLVKQRRHAGGGRRARDDGRRRTTTDDDGRRRTTTDDDGRTTTTDDGGRR
eukprot:144318-Pyramimonas_sp.AAC.1